MEHPAALHRIRVGVPATVEHSSEAGPETGKWVAQTTQVRRMESCIFKIMLTTFFHETELYHLHGRPETAATGERSAASYSTRARHGIREV
jgi:hypothetical protein